MKRRCVATLAAATVASPWAIAPAMAQAKKIEDGVDFISLEKPARVDAPNSQVEVVEFFWYKCQHCNRFEPDLEKWVAKLPKDVAFKRVPIAFRDDFVPQQRMFYALEAMGKIHEVHRKVFAAIHEQKLALDTLDQIATWVAGQGVDRAAFVTQYESFSVQSKASKGTQLQRAYNVSGVPSLGVAGLYYTDGSLAPSMARALEAVDFLIARQRKAKRGDAKA